MAEKINKSNREELLREQAALRRTLAEAEKTLKELRTPKAEPPAPKETAQAPEKKTGVYNTPEGIEEYKDGVLLSKTLPNATIELYSSGKIIERIFPDGSRESFDWDGSSLGRWKDDVMIPFNTPITPSEAEEPAPTGGTAPKPSQETQKTKLERDRLYEKALRIVSERGRASTSTLQRELRLGYGRAARILDEMQADGIIGPTDGTTKPRDIILSPEQIEDFISGHEFTERAPLAFIEPEDLEQNEPSITRRIKKFDTMPDDLQVTPENQEALEGQYGSTAVEERANTQRENAKAEVVAKLRDAIANAEKILSDNKIEEEKDRLLVENLRKKLSEIKEKKRMEEDEKLEKERTEKIEKDKRANFFKYFLIDEEKMSDPAIRLLFGKGREEISLEDLNRVMGVIGKEDVLIHSLSEILPAKSNAIFITSNGFSLQLQNAEEVSTEENGKKIVDIKSPKARYNLVTPKGIYINKAALSYKKGRNLLEETARQYQKDQLAEFESQK